MTVDVTTEILIQRARTDVAAYAANPDNAPHWYSNIKEVHWETPRPLTLGSRLEFEAVFLGRTLSYTYEVIELEAGSRLVMSTAQGPFPMTTEYTWSEVAERVTRMALRNHGEPSGFAALTAPLLAAQIRRANEADLRRLKAILEAERQNKRAARQTGGPTAGQGAADTGTASPGESNPAAALQTAAAEGCSFHSS